MQTINISLPDQLKEFADNQVGSGRYSSVSEYVRDLIREDEKRKAQEKLEALLIEGIQSGVPTEMTRQDWAGIRREALKQFEVRTSMKTAFVSQMLKCEAANRDLIQQWVWYARRYQSVLRGTG